MAYSSTTLTLSGGGGTKTLPGNEDCLSKGQTSQLTQFGRVTHDFKPYFTISRHGLVFTYDDDWATTVGSSKLNVASV